MIEHIEFWWAVVLLLAIYLIWGSVVGLTGFIIGRRSQHLAGIPDQDIVNNNENYNPFLYTGKFNYSNWALMLLVLIIPVVMIGIHSLGLLWGTLVFMVFVSFCLFRYINFLRRLRKPVFWLQLLIITLLATFFAERISPGGNSDSHYGLIVGTKMVMRAIIVVIGFSAISVELKNPVIRDFLFKYGLRSLYIAVSMAFAILPSMIANLDKPKTFLTNPMYALARTISKANVWLEAIKKQSL